MGLIILLFMIGVPIVEIAVFLEAGERFGLWPTLAGVILTAVIGTALLRHQGLATLARAQESLAREEFPLAEVFDGLCLLLAGALLLTPGFLTDAVGFLLFTPPLRSLLKATALHYLSTRGTIHTATSSRPPGANGVIDGEFTDVTPADRPEGDTQSPERPTRLPPTR